MKKLIKTLIKIGAVAAVAFFGAPLLTALAGGFIALRGVDVIDGIATRRRQRSAAGTGADEALLRKNEREHRENSRKRFFDFREGQWNVHEFPMDMYPSVGLKDRGQAMFTVAGVENVVRGSVTRDAFGRQKARFSMEIHDEAKANDVAELVRSQGIIGTRVVRLDSGAFEIVSDNAADICTIVKQFYPPRSFEVARSVETTRQFVVEGCATYEEALAKFKANRGNYVTPAAVKVSYQNIIDGHAEPEERFGEGVSGAAVWMEAGSWVIDETTREYFSRNVTVNGGVDMTDEAMRSNAAEAVVFKHEDKVEDRCSHEPVYSNGLQDAVVERKIQVGRNNILLVEEQSAALEKTGASMYVSFKSLDELLAVASGDKPLGSRIVLVDTVRPEPGQGEFILEVPADGRLLSSLDMGTDSSEFSRALSHYGPYGVSADDISRSLVVDELQRTGYVSARLTDVPSMDRAMVNGVPVKEFVERSVAMVKDGRAEALRDDVQRKRWLDDAAQVKSVHLDVDMRRRKVILTSTVQYQERMDIKMEEYPSSGALSFDQMESLQRKGLFSDAELKDLVLQLHPDIFQSYRAPGSTDDNVIPLYADPMRDFIEGRRRGEAPSRQPEASESKEKAKESRQAPKPRKNIPGKRHV